MSLEVFRRNAARAHEPAISIAPNGRCTFNASAGRTVFAKTKERNEKLGVLILYDKSTHAFGLMLSSLQNHDAFPISVPTGPNRVNSVSVQLSQFFSSIGWIADYRLILPLMWQEEEQMWKTTLPSEYVTGKRLKRRRTNSKASGGPK